MMYAASVEHIRSLLPKVLRKRGLIEHANAALVILKAREWIAGHLQDFENDLHPQKFRDGVLTIACAHSIASQECQQRLQPSGVVRPRLSCVRSTAREVISTVLRSKEGLCSVVERT